MAFFDLPIMVLFAKITPQHIEGTVFAFLTGTINFASGVLRPSIGSFINDVTFKVNKDNLSDDNMLKLNWLATLMSLLPLLFMWLIPMRKDVEALQLKFMAMAE